MSKAADLANLIGNINMGGGKGGRNMWINGACTVAQRSTSTSGLGDGNEGYVTVDRMRESGSTLSAGRYTSAQSTDAPAGFANSFHINCTTADTSIAAGELLFFGTRFEGQNLQHLKKGSSEALPSVISFYMKTNKAFTFVVEVKDKDNSRDCHFQFTTSTDWTRHEFTVPGDTTGAYDNDNANSLDIHIWMHGGSTYTGGTHTEGTWSSVTNANRAVGIGSFYDSTDNDVKMTGFQYEVGQNATEFEHEDISTTLSKCQRYFNKMSEQLYGGYGTDSAADYATIWFPTEMRDDPTMTGVGTSNTAQAVSEEFAQCYRVGGYAVWSQDATADAEL